MKPMNFDLVLELEYINGEKCKITLKHEVKDREAELSRVLNYFGMYFGDAYTLHDSNYNIIAKVLSDPEELSNWLVNNEDADADAEAEWRAQWVTPQF